MLATATPTMTPAQEYTQALVDYVTAPSPASERHLADAAKFSGLDWSKDAKLLRRHLESHRHVKAEGKRLKSEAASSAAAFTKLEKSIREQITAMERTLAEAGGKNSAAQAAARDVARSEVELRIARGEITASPDDNIVRHTAVPGLLLSKPARVAFTQLIEGK